MHWFWLSTLVVFIVLEAATSALVSLWFIGGSIAAVIATCFGAPVWAQVILFLSISIALLFALRPLAKKIVAPNKIVTNARSNIGKLAIVTETIDEIEGKGAVKISGVVWSARSADGSIIKEGTRVRVTDLTGAKVCVEKELKEANL